MLHLVFYIYSYVIFSVSPLYPHGATAGDNSVNFANQNSHSREVLFDAMLVNDRIVEKLYVSITTSNTWVIPSLRNLWRICDTLKMLHLSTYFIAHAITFGTLCKNDLNVKFNWNIQILYSYRNCKIIFKTQTYLYAINLQYKLVAKYAINLRPA